MDNGNGFKTPVSNDKHTGLFGLCAYSGGLLCGTVIGNAEQFYNGILFNLREFWVENSMRGLGIGTEVFKELERQLNGKGINRIILFTSKGMYTEHFYSKQGMTPDGSMVFMEKVITNPAKSN